ncbi:MAG TPA: hypothetical protein VH595_13675 [Verrucomicrobiae bacterium]|nr:hypothetical protein [Verrucomicrobiae bacterium]
MLVSNDAVAQAAPSRWAAGYLQAALNARGVSARICNALEQVSAGQESIVAAGRESAEARAGGINLPDVPEGLGLGHTTIGGNKVLLAIGADTQGLVYALLDLADRVKQAENPMAALRGVESSLERPANCIRSAMRSLVSEVEDKTWYHDRAFWRDYLTMLAAQRFNRFNLALGIGYDGSSGLRDGYFYFAYPFLVQVPGYDVKVARFSDEERAANLETLKFISDEAALRGLHFQLGIWTHGYKWTDGPRVNYVIEGLTDDRQAEYSRDALQAVLEACLAIKGVTIRIHGESGVPEGNYDFWKTVFDGMVRTGRPLELDMHAKGMDQKTIEVALATGLPVTISPKFWGEHTGLPYMQAAIRNLEMPARNAQDKGFFSLSSGSRSFLRYSYGDLLAEGRKYQVLHRVWPGTQRILLWGDPAMAAALGRNWSFCGTDGFELMEPLSFKGRRASGLPGGRDGYADATLSTGGSGWEKFLYTYRMWGRLGYNPDAKPETWQRMLRKQFGPGAESAEAALSSASRLLPIITSAHAPSAGNNNYWPEMYLNQPIMADTRRGLYDDSPAPRRFGTVSPMDPQMFLTVEQFAGELIQEKRGCKYSPADVARWLETLALDAKEHLARAERATLPRGAPEFRRMSVDVAIQNGTGLFFAWKFRAAVLYALYEKSGHRPALALAVTAYGKARAAWAELVNHSKGAYVADVTYGLTPELRGNWADRLAAIDADIAAMQKKMDETPQPMSGNSRVIEHATELVLLPEKQVGERILHTAPKTFKRGQALTVEVTAPGRMASARLHYRRVNQAETWRVTDMGGKSEHWSAAIPAEYTDSAFPLAYYFELCEGPRARLYPGLGANLMGQPYFVVRQS